MAVLDVRELEVCYDKVRALRGVSFSVQMGEIVTLIGANGAGKSTTLKAISGLLPLAGGEIFFGGEPLEPLLPHEIVARGVVQVPEGRRIFGRLTVRENLEIGAFARRDGKAAVAADIEAGLVLFPRLAERLRQVAGTLSGGEQQMLAIARALMSRPQLLLLDEPSMGIAPILVDQIFRALSEINARGVTLVLVEQNAALALEFCHRAYVLETGAVALAGSGRELLANDAVGRAYLG
jgi:branched-chain amino acid transport system ATP-binding protein